MDIQFKPITQEQAEQIAHHWHYEGIYAFYNMEADEEDLAEFMDPHTRGDSVFVAMKSEELIAFISLEVHSVDHIELGLGLRPDLTGQGFGVSFLSQALNYIKTHFSPKIITLAVATFNKRAISLYKKIGFIEKSVYMQNTNGGEYEFVRMKYFCN